MGRRPPHVKPPAHWTKSPPPPEPDAAARETRGEDDPLGRDPTRYGDWELNGIAVDF